MKIINHVIFSLPILSLASASSSQLSAATTTTTTKNIRGSKKNQEKYNNRLSTDIPPQNSNNRGLHDDNHHYHYESDDFELMENEDGYYGRCVDREHRRFDYMRYEWDFMSSCMSSSSEWERNEDYRPKMCEEWCFSTHDYYKYYHGYHERMHDYDHYYRYFIGFEVSDDECSCIYDHGFGHWMEESYGMDTSTWPGGRYPIYTTDGQDEWDTTTCYGYTHYRKQEEEGEDDSINDRFLQSSSCSGEQQFESTYIKAEIDTEYLKATVYGKDSAPGQADWTITINHVDPNLCPEYETLYFHIHQFALMNPGCKGYSGLIANGSVQQCMTTGGHVDPGLACGGASQYLDTTCKALNYADPYSTRCTTERQNGCEYGDLSGKVGQVKLDTTEAQVFHDKFIQTPIADWYYARSMTFHCGEPRVACANLEVASADDIYY